MSAETITKTGTDYGQAAHDRAVSVTVWEDHTAGAWDVRHGDLVSAMTADDAATVLDEDGYLSDEAADIAGAILRRAAVGWDAEFEVFVAAPGSAIVGEVFAVTFGSEFYTPANLEEGTAALSAVLEALRPLLAPVGDERGLFGAVADMMRARSAAGIDHWPATVMILNA